MFCLRPPHPSDVQLQQQQRRAAAAVCSGSGVQQQQGPLICSICSYLHGPRHHHSISNRNVFLLHA